MLMDEKRVSLSNVILLILEKAVEGGELMRENCSCINRKRKRVFDAHKR